MISNSATCSMESSISLPFWSRLTPRSREAAKWAGTALFFIGSAITSLSPTLSLAWWPYCFFTLGHSLWSIGGYLMRDRAVLALNVMYLPFDLSAILVRI